MDKHKRPRILYKPKDTCPLIVDELEFVKNKCSVKARLVKVMGLTINIYVWFDQHYYHRYHTGDCNGKRNNINPEIIEEFVTKSVPYLVLFSTIVKGFSFLNYTDYTTTPIKVVLKDLTKGLFLNVVIECHYTNPTHYEITVKTALCAEDFRISAGQYFIEVETDGVNLKKFDNNKFSEICRI